nr:beta-L-arabinofuranosidase domain-containing protein [Microbacterium sulfonylureivorans]
MDEVSLSEDGYWGVWQAVNAASILPHCASWMESEGWVDNFRAAAEGTLPETRRGREFTDSDVYKLIEAMSWENGRLPTPALEAEIRQLIDIVGDAQEPDGYINTNFGRPGQVARYADLEWGSELYGDGHLLQAAVARARTSGRDRLFEIATRLADHICDTFGPEGIQSVCGHPEIELGLIEFARLTGVERYRRQAELFLERRGHHVLEDIEFGRAYYQDDVPIRDAAVFRGHAVRATYLAAAAVDVGIDRNDTSLVEAIRAQLNRTLARRTYVTGGMGSRFRDEAFGADFELPADGAYSETCAGVGAFMLAWRLLLATDDAAYGDLMERVLYNVITASPSPDGRAFFYVNTLHQRAIDDRSDGAQSSLQVGLGERAPWFRVSCCPTNVSRTFATLEAYVGVADSRGLAVSLFARGRITARLDDGSTAEAEIDTDYPHDGRIVVRVPARDAGGWRLRLRVPAWAQGATIRRDGTAPIVVAPGWVDVDDVGIREEEIELLLPLEPRFVFGDPRIDSARGAVAVERGPRVYCVESPDIAGAHVDGVIVDTASPPWMAGTDEVTVSAHVEQLESSSWPYAARPAAAGSPVARDVRLTPYNEWARRGPSTMRVWMRTE